METLSRQAWVPTRVASSAGIAAAIGRRITRGNGRAVVKALIVSALVCLPSSLWPMASAIVRRVWPGVRHA